MVTRRRQSNAPATKFWQQSVEKWHRWKIIVIIFRIVHSSRCYTCEMRDVVGVHGRTNLPHKNRKAFGLNAVEHAARRWKTNNVENPHGTRICRHTDSHRIITKTIDYNRHTYIITERKRCCLQWSFGKFAPVQRRHGAIDNGQLPAIFDIIYRWYVIVIGHAAPYNMCRLWRGRKRETEQLNALSNTIVIAIIGELDRSNLDKARNYVLCDFFLFNLICRYTLPASIAASVFAAVCTDCIDAHELFSASYIDCVAHPLLAENLRMGAGWMLCTLPTNAITGENTLAIISILFHWRFDFKWTTKCYRWL